MYPIHSHGAWLNAEGTGNTDVDSGHFHVVKNFRVQADPSDGHTHDLTTLPCGTGQPRNVNRQNVLVPESYGRGFGHSDLQLMGPERDWGKIAMWGVGALVVAGAIIGGIMLYNHSRED
jgi:hypothetical protein